MFVVELLFRVKRIMQDCEDELEAFVSWKDPNTTSSGALTNAQRFPKLGLAATLSWEEVLVTWTDEELEGLLQAMNSWRHDVQEDAMCQVACSVVHARRRAVHELTVVVYVATEL